MPNNGYTDHLVKMIRTYKVGQPIMTVVLADSLVKEFGVPGENARRITAVAMKRILDTKRIPELRRHEKGIYYIAEQTPFGETRIDVDALIRTKYLHPHIGYDGGRVMLHRLGLTSLMPNQREIVTNRALEGSRIDTVLHVVLRKPPTMVNAENQHYLQFLEILSCMDRAPIDAPAPYQQLDEFIRQYGLRYDRLLALSNRYFPERVLRGLAMVADKGGINA